MEWKHLWIILPMVMKLTQAFEGNGNYVNTITFLYVTSAGKFHSKCHDLLIFKTTKAAKQFGVVVAHFIPNRVAVTSFFLFVVTITLFALRIMSAF